MALVKTNAPARPRLSLIHISSVEKDVFLQNEYIKIGADLVYGGGLSYLEYIKEPVALVTLDGRAEDVYKRQSR